METKIINSGNFATKEGQMGNFSAYPLVGPRFFINKKVMENAGFIKDSDVNYPFYALVTEKEIETRTEDGELSGVKVMREQATAIFTDMAKLTEALTASKRIEIMCAQNLKSAVETAGLTVDELRSLTTTSI